MIQETYNRLTKKFKPEEILVTVTKGCLAEAEKQLPDLPKENFIVEPYATGTLGSCGIAIEAIHRRDPEASAIFVPSDHIITQPNEFIKIVDFVEDLIGGEYSDHMILIGINPTKPDTGMGYIQMDSQVEVKDDLKLFSVKRFVEKPDLETAKKYVTQWDYLWNGGMFAWKIKHIRDLYAKYAKESFDALEKVGEKFGTPEYSKVAETEYPKIDKTSIDYAISEKTDDIMVVPGDFGWSDVGSWGTLLEVLVEEYGSKVVSKGHFMGVDNDKCLVMANDKLIATVGLEDIIVVDTPDAMLICKGDKSHEVKDLIEKLKAEGKGLYL
jgi:mannose-1-phosphate guanylyltransferase